VIISLLVGIFILCCTGVGLNCRHPAISLESKITVVVDVYETTLLASDMSEEFKKLVHAELS